MKTEIKERVFQVAYLNRGFLINLLTTKSNPKMAEFTFDKSIDTILRITKSKSKSEFKDDKHILNYLSKAMLSNLKRNQAIEWYNSIPPLTPTERDYWFDFTRNLFDGVLSKIPNPAK